MSNVAARPDLGRIGGSEAGNERAVRASSAAVAAGRDPEASYACRQRHGAEGDRQGADPKRGVGEGPRQARPYQDREAALTRLRVKLLPTKCAFPSPG